MKTHFTKKPKMTKKKKKTEKEKFPTARVDPGQHKNFLWSFRIQPQRISPTFDKLNEIK